MLPQGIQIRGNFGLVDFLIYIWFYICEKYLAGLNIMILAKYDTKLVV